MTIDPARLRDGIYALLGQLISEDEAAMLAGNLGITEEILPWLVLKSPHWDKSSSFDAQLRDRARNAPVAMTRRATAARDTRATQEARKILKDMIAQAIDYDKLNRRIAQKIVKSRADVVRYQGK